jgi:hypothetical protein
MGPSFITEIAHWRDQPLFQLKVNLFKAPQFMKKYHDKNRRSYEFQIEDILLVILQPSCRHSVSLSRNQKLGLCCFDPFPVIDKIRPVTYKLLLAAKIHDVFHSSLLKPCKGNHPSLYIPLPLLTMSKAHYYCPNPFYHLAFYFNKVSQYLKHLFIVKGFQVMMLLGKIGFKYKRIILS